MARLGLSRLRARARKKLRGIIRNAGLNLQNWPSHAAFENRVPEDPAQGSVSEDEEAVCVLGRGAFGCTYLMPDQQTAVKVVNIQPSNPGLLVELLAEYQRARVLPAHPLLLAPREHWLARVAAGQGQKRRLQYMQEMSAALGGTLVRTIKAFQQQRRSGCPPSERSVCRVLAQLLGLARLMHTAGIVHRDLKPNNLLLLSSSGPPVLHVCDFGAATRTGRLYSSSKPQDCIFTLEYAAPELLDPECPALPACPSQDMFSVGVIAYQLLTGVGTHPLVPQQVLDNLRKPEQQHNRHELHKADPARRQENRACHTKASTAHDDPVAALAAALGVTCSPTNTGLVELESLKGSPAAADDPVAALAAVFGLTCSLAGQSVTQQGMSVGMGMGGAGADSSPASGMSSSMGALQPGLGMSAATDTAFLPGLPDGVAYEGGHGGACTASVNLPSEVSNTGPFSCSLLTCGEPAQQNGRASTSTAAAAAVPHAVKAATAMDVRRGNVLYTVQQSGEHSCSGVESDESMVGDGCCGVLHRAMRRFVVLPELPAGYQQEAWQDLIQGLCAVEPAARWDWKDALCSPLLSGAELLAWAGSARAGASMRRDGGDTHEADVLDALAQMYEDLQAEQARLLEQQQQQQEEPHGMRVRARTADQVVVPASTQGILRCLSSSSSPTTGSTRQPEPAASTLWPQQPEPAGPPIGHQQGDTKRIPDKTKEFILQHGLNQHGECHATNATEHRSPALVSLSDKIAQLSALLKPLSLHVPGAVTDHDLTDA